MRKLDFGANQNACAALAYLYAWPGPGPAELPTSHVEIDEHTTAINALADSIAELSKEAVYLIQTGKSLGSILAL